MNQRSSTFFRPAEERLHRLDQGFSNAVAALHQKLEDLMGAKPFQYVARPRSLPENVVYLFSEFGKPLYIGRSRNFSQRLGNHCRSSSRGNQSSFAFKLACEMSGIAQTRYSGPNTREKLMEIPEFAKAFLEAKDRLNAMQIRFVEEGDVIRQALLEIYCAVALATPYNVFSTH
jgi:hypothetical protein